MKVSKQIPNYYNQLVLIFVNLKEIEHVEEIVILSGFLDDFFKYTYVYLLKNKLSYG